ncbi:glycosyltransferase family 4 protein [Arsukibacterium sp.]|uniref:glycosyltransferase family 4 protein n=1 Tax=Arsukibacterium sp. TaxID=1977258 RepID=UPI002FD8CBC2
MRILLVGPVPPPNGGMAMQTAQLQQLLTADASCSVTLLAVNAPYQPAWLGHIPLVRAFARLVLYIWRLHQQLKTTDLVHLMANSGWAWHLFASPVLLLARWHSKPVVLNYRGGSAQQFLKKQHKWVLPFMKMASAIVTPSPYLQRVFAQYQLHVSVIANIINTGMFKPATASVAKQNLHLVVTRNLEPLYDIGTAIRCFAALQQHYPDSQMSIAGSGPCLAELQALVSTLQLEPKVHFVGRLNREQIVALYQSADIMLNPSTVDNMPNSILEALACGVLVVSTAVGGIPDMLEHNSHALLVAPGQPEQMAEACLQLLQQPELAKHLQRQGLLLVQQLQPDVILPLWLKLYQQLGHSDA